jgi:hypothetical protein
VGVSSSGAVQAGSFQNGAGRTDGPSSRVTLSSRRAGSPDGTQSVTSSPPPITSTEATAYQHGNPGYGTDELGYVQVEVPYGGPRPGNAAWVGPVMPDERDRGLRRLSTEERTRLRSDIRDASRNMYDLPRAR